MEDIINNYYQQGGIAMMIQDLAENKIEPSKFWQHFREEYTSIDNVHTMMTNTDLQDLLTYHYDEIGFSMDTEEYEIYEELLEDNDEISYTEVLLESMNTDLAGHWIRTEPIGLQLGLQRSRKTNNQ